MLVAALAVLLLQSSTPAFQCRNCGADQQSVERVQTASASQVKVADKSPASIITNEQPSSAKPAKTEALSPDIRLSKISEATPLADPADPIVRAEPPSFPAVIVKPSAQDGKPHRFMDRANLIGLAVHAAVRVTDATQTCVLLGRPGRKEVWLPMTSCGGIAAYSLSMIPAQVGSSYFLHRTGHHKLERWLPYMWAAPSAVGIGVSVKSW